MRIGLSARALQLPAGGVKEYTFNLIRALLQLDRCNEYVVFHSHSARLGLFPSSTEVVLPGENKLWWDYVQLPAAVKQHKIDLLWTPSTVIPFPIRCTAVATVHDLAYFTFPESYQRIDVAYMRTAMPASFRRVAALLAVSDYTRRDIIRLFPFAADKITVTYEAAAARYRSDLDDRLREAVRTKYALPQHYLFYAGSISPRKGLSYLLEAFAMLKQRYDLPQRLVFTGGWQWGNTGLTALMDRLGLRNEIVILGDVPGEDMPALYALADLFVYPSLYEGFGLPVLEAMACGCPVVSSNLTSLPEVTGDAAVLVNPRDVAALADALGRVLTDAALRDDLIARGLARVAAFSWEMTARKTLTVFEQARQMPP
jgi:glycosyltransferase involved in cell wall biosynthesis